MTRPKIEKKSNFSIRSMKGKSVETKLEALGIDGIQATKEKVYDCMLEYVEVEGYPSEEDSKEASINHLVCSILYPIILNFRWISGRQGTQLRSEKEIISVDGETGKNWIRLG